MGENEFVFCAAVLERCCQPVVLRLSERPVPRVFRRAWIGDRVPERIKHDEQGIAPLPRVIILEQAKRSATVVFGSRIAGVEASGNGCRIVCFACDQIPCGDVVQGIGGGIEKIAIFRLVVAQGEKIRHRVTSPLEVGSQDQGARVHPRLVRKTAAVLRGDAGDRIVHLVRHENVTQVDVEIRLVECDVRQGLGEESRIRVEVEVGIRRDREHKRRTPWPCGAEAAFAARIEEGCTRVPITQPVVVFRVGEQTGERELNRSVRGGKISDRCRARIGT